MQSDQPGVTQKGQDLYPSPAVYTTLPPVQSRRSFPGGSVVKNLVATSGDVSSILGSGISPGEGNSNPLEYSCLGHPVDRGAWRAAADGVDTTEQLKQQ